MFVIYMLGVADQLPHLVKRELNVCYSLLVIITKCGFCSEGFPLPPRTLDGLRYFNGGTPWAFHIIIL